MTQLNRRDFLKALGVTSTSAAAACNWDTNQYQSPVENILPYVVKPEQVTPGTYTFFATSILRGPHAHAVTARHRDGRVTMVSHNRFAPGGPSIQSAEFMELQKHYSPDRLQGPEGGWDAGLEKLATAMKAAKAAGKKVAYLGPYASGTFVELVNAVADTAVFYEPLGYEAEAAAAEALFGKRVLPFYALEKAGYVLSFGAPFLSGWGDADVGERFATAKDPNVDHRVGRFALVAPMMDQTGSNADDWFHCTPGTEVLVAKAIAKLVAEQTHATAITALLGSVDVAAAATASGVSEETLSAIATHMASDDGLALPGGAGGSTDLAAATYLINLAAGAAPSRFHLGGFQGPVSGWADVASLLADLDGGKIGVLVVGEGIDPVYAFPGDVDVAGAMAKADLTVSLSSHPSATTAAAGLVLPTSDAFEDWGDESPRAGVWLMRQPAMTPLYDTRSAGDVLLAAGKAAGLAPEPVEGEMASPLASASWKDLVADMWKAYAWDGSGDFARFWETVVVEGVFTVDAGDVAPVLTATSYTWDAAEAVAGDTVLVAYPHAHRGDGRYANQPWAQEVPDPLHGYVWGSWLEVSPGTAASLGLTTRDEVEIKGPAGSATLGVHVTKAVADGILGLAFGNGHAQTGRYADGYGVNAASLFTALADGKGQLVWLPISVAVSKTGVKLDNKQFTTAFSEFGTTDQGRAFGVHVSAEKLAAVGDAEAHHPGELTGIHHLELDDRLNERKIEGFYGTPDHSTYRFGMTVDTNACTGCGACSVACYAENNLPVVGRQKVGEGREMGWIRINRYFEEAGGHPKVQYVPMMCQQCGHAGCENVCPVLATYHNIDGLNAMVYNRCVGTRYCSNACPFSARKFNYHTYQWPEPFNLQLNPDVVTRTMGVMEKCTFCVQRLRQTKSAYKDREGFTATVPDSAWQQVPACVEACPSQALTFGNLKDPEGACSQSRKSGRTYEPLGELRPLSAVNYLAKANFHDDPTAGHGGGHGGGHADEAHEGSHSTESSHDAHEAESHGAEQGGHDEAGAAGHDAH